MTMITPTNDAFVASMTDYETRANLMLDGGAQPDEMSEFTQSYVEVIAARIMHSPENERVAYVKALTHEIGERFDTHDANFHDAMGSDGEVSLGERAVLRARCDVALDFVDELSRQLDDAAPVMLIARIESFTSVNEQFLNSIYGRDNAYWNFVERTRHSVASFGGSLLAQNMNYAATLENSNVPQSSPSTQFMWALERETVLPEGFWESFIQGADSLSRTPWGKDFFSDQWITQHGLETEVAFAREHNPSFNEAFGQRAATKQYLDHMSKALSR